MSKNNTSGGSTSPGNETCWPTDLREILHSVQAALDRNQIENALAMLTQVKLNSPWIQNALGVCQLRLGDSSTAIEVFARLVLSQGGVVVRRDVPTIFLTNYATALLASRNLPGCLWILNEIQEKNHGSVTRLREAMKRWRASLTLWQRFSLALGNEPDAAPPLDFPPGDLA